MDNEIILLLTAISVLSLLSIVSIILFVVMYYKFERMKKDNLSLKSMYFDMMGIVKSIIRSNEL